jgi:pyruvate formate lyase activating enzyme
VDAPARFWHPLADGRIQCDLCPRDCKLHAGQKGFCFVRERQGDRMVLSTYGRSSGFCVDPIEKKPLAHFHPGSSVLSFGTAGCNLGCRFCQNWDISKAKELDARTAEARPEQIAATAARLGCESVAFTYNDPTIFAEYAMDVADACRARGIKTVAVTAGYIRAEPRRAFYEKIDAANVDLKAFAEGFYEKLCFAHLGPILETLEYLAKETKVWLEVTTLLIPGHNDSEEEVGRLLDWYAEHLGPLVPLHFSAFHPDFKMLDTEPTPPSTLRRARAQALRAGLKHVYLGNVHDIEADTTSCAACGEPLIVRDWYEILEYRLTSEGRCPGCAAPLAGRFGARAGSFGRRRMPLLRRDLR